MASRDRGAALGFAIVNWNITLGGAIAMGAHRSSLREDSQFPRTSYSPFPPSRPSRLNGIQIWTRFLHTSSNACLSPSRASIFFFLLSAFNLFLLLVALMPYGRQDYARFQADLDKYKDDFPSVSREDGSSILYYSRNLELARARTHNALEAQRDLESLQTSLDVEAGRRAWTRVLQVLDVPDSSLEEQIEEWRSSGGSITQALAALLPSAPIIYRLPRRRRHRRSPSRAFPPTPLA
ncbi:hypothetical protein DFH08DRAFT_900577 [Mycena albidolilacea]|uniref:Uncharacterized protein n=1 Tax=Mycena albidolilacea TaxID=1033008 RepID=A0AAD6Z5Q1_9AGAR|nr:hypothetical protein DFH08DRAFT_900577 [Mycena albidolilacea]